MKISEFKTILSNHLDKLIGEWFGDKPLFNAIAKTAVKANINRFDNLLNMLVDEQGDLLVEELVDNLGEAIERGYEIDLTEISTLLPKRVLLISKEDIQNLLKDIR